MAETAWQTATSERLPGTPSVNSWLILSPVSYTHLDVYKRQMFDIARNALGLPQSRVVEWLALSPGERQHWLHQADQRASAALLLLEEASLCLLYTSRCV